MRMVGSEFGLEDVGGHSGHCRSIKLSSYEKSRSPLRPRNCARKENESVESWVLAVPTPPSGSMSTSGTVGS